MKMTTYRNGEALGTKIRRLIADDPDEGENGRVSYSIREQSSPVAINPDSERNECYSTFINVSLVLLSSLNSK